MYYTEKRLEEMASPIGKTEQEKCKHAIGMVRDAMKLLDYTDDGRGIRESYGETYAYTLSLRQRSSSREITLLVQGSYANKTNIPSQSDVDVAVILESVFTPKFRHGVTEACYGFTKAVYTIAELKNEVEKALKMYFRNQGVERHNKCIKVRGNTYRVDADVVPAQRYRDYSNDWSFDADNYLRGIEIWPDRGAVILNYPEIHIKNGIEKNKETAYLFKKLVRVAKHIKEDMLASKFSVSDAISSFGIESLLWNVPGSCFLKRGSKLGYVFSDVISFLNENQRNFDNYKEVNGIKKLFKCEAEKFAYQRFIVDLNVFFRYNALGV